MSYNTVHSYLFKYPSSSVSLQPLFHLPVTSQHSSVRRQLCFRLQTLNFHPGSSFADTAVKGLPMLSIADAATWSIPQITQPPSQIMLLCASI